MKFVFVVQHSCEQDGREEVKFIGACTLTKDAQLAVRRKKRYPRFRKYPRGFHISKVEIGRDQWSEGFIKA